MPGRRHVPAVFKRRKEIGKRLRVIRKQFVPGGTWRAREIAAWLGVASETWYGYERGKPIPGDIVLRLILELGISPRWLLSGHGTIRPEETSAHRSSRDDAPSKE